MAIDNTLIHKQIGTADFSRALTRKQIKIRGIRGVHIATRATENLNHIQEAIEQDLKGSKKDGALLSDKAKNKVVKAVTEKMRAASKQGGNALNCSFKDSAIGIADTIEDKDVAEFAQYRFDKAKSAVEKAMKKSKQKNKAVKAAEPKALKKANEAAEEAKKALNKAKAEQDEAQAMLNSSQDQNTLKGVKNKLINAQKDVAESAFNAIKAEANIVASSTKPMLAIGRFTSLFSLIPGAGKITSIVNKVMRKAFGERMGDDKINENAPKERKETKVEDKNNEKHVIHEDKRIFLDEPDEHLSDPDDDIRMRDNQIAALEVLLEKRPQSSQTPKTAVEKFNAFLESVSDSNPSVIAATEEKLKNNNTSIYDIIDTFFWKEKSNPGFTNIPAAYFIGGKKTKHEGNKYPWQSNKRATLTPEGQKALKNLCTIAKKYERRDGGEQMMQKVKAIRYAMTLTPADESLG